MNFMQSWLRIRHGWIGGVVVGLAILLWWSGGSTAVATSGLAQATIPAVDNPIFLPLVSNVYNATLPGTPPQLPTVFISEFSAANQTIIKDEDGESSDWVEIFNAGTEAVNLQGWRLTDNPQDLAKWQFPNVVVPSGGYLLVFASNKDRTTDPAHLHTNFKLTRYGGYLALVKPDGTSIAWEYVSREQYPDLSYGIDATGYARYFRRPSPGAPNGTSEEDAAPALSEVHHQAEPIRTGENVVVTAVAATTSQSLQVWLHYQVMFGATVDLPMYDDGLHGDTGANDHIYGAEIPASAYTTAQMVRYFVTATDGANRTARLPLFLDPNANAQYYGTVIQPDYTGSQLPVVHWFVQNYSAANKDIGTRASLYYAGEFYDNVFVRQRGDYTRQFEKKSYKFDMTEDHPLLFSPDEHRVTEINLNSTYTDRDYIRPVLAWQTYRDAGVPYSISFPVRMQRNGNFHSVAIFVEQPDKDYLDRQGLDPDGALYKMHTTMLAGTSGGFEKKTRPDEDFSDYQALRSQLFLPADARRRFLYDNVNLPEVINYLAATAIMHDNDAITKNYYLYRDSDNTGEWQIFPWDKDLTFGRMYVETLLSTSIWADTDPYSHPLFGNASHARFDDKWNQLIDALYAVPEIREMYLRRLRTLMDQLLNAPGTPYAQQYYEPRIDTLYSLIKPDVALDQAAWPPDWAKDQSFDAAINAIKTEYLPKRRTHLFQTHGPAGDGIVPAAQPSAFSLNLGEVALDYTTPSHDQEYFTVVNPNDFAADISGWRVTGSVEYTFQPGVVIPAGGTLYVAASSPGFRNRGTSPRGDEGRLVQGGYENRLSTSAGRVNLQNASGALIATLGFATPLSDATGHLVITELNYHPPNGFGVDGEEFEFIELKNIGDSELNLAGAQFSEGIDFVFPPGATLHPGEFAVLARNRTAFQQRYPDVTIAGEYTKKLSNDGERLTLIDAVGRRIFSFTYGTAAPWPSSADGGGETLVNVRPEQWPDQVCDWRANAQLYGTPGKDDQPVAQETCPYAVYLPVVTHD